VLIGYVAEPFHSVRGVCCCCTHLTDVDVYDQALDTPEGDAAADDTATRRYDQITNEEIQRATAAGSGGGSTEYDSAPLDAPPSADRGLQPAALEAGYGGSDSVMNTAQARPRSNTEWGKGAAADSAAGAKNGARPGNAKGKGKGQGKGKGIKRSERQGSILAGFDDADAEA